MPPLYFKLKKYIRKNLIKKPDHRYVHPILQTYSWEYEDLVLSDIFSKQNYGNYLDIGCNDPILGNNTFRFYHAGWKGINIDLDIHNIVKYQKIRPRDLSLCEVISDSKSQVEIIRQKKDTSLSRVNLLKNVKGQKNKKPDAEIRFTMTLFEIYEKHIKDLYEIDILSIDTEGSELNILRSNNWNTFRPTTVCMEINSDFGIIQDFFSSLDYLLIFFNPSNAIFLDLHTNYEHIKKKFNI